MDIRAARVPEEIPLVRALFQEYAEGLGIDLCFQGFEAELAGLPGAYAPPAGRLLLSVEGDEVVGCIALRPLDAGTCEMKRLYVRPAHRGSGAGRRLAERVLAEAAGAGYRTIRLDTLPVMARAIGLYRALGFTETAPYCHNPVPGALYFEKDLGSAGSE
jgi:ribosomal protein S18 acetylase RimI-like enzyme